MAAGESHIRVLDWYHAAITDLLHDKSRRVLVQARRSSHGGSDWLACTTIRNKVDWSTNQSRDYLLRHTRLLPRDIIMLGKGLPTDPMTAPVGITPAPALPSSLCMDRRHACNCARDVTPRAGVTDGTRT